MAWGVPKLGTIVDDSTGNFTLVEPAGVAQGDLMIACIAMRDTTVVTPPSGWSVAAPQQNSGDVDTTDGIASGCMFYIVRGASAPDLVCVRASGGSSYSRIISYSGGSSTPFDVGSSATQGAAGNTPTTASLTTAEDGELIVAMVAYGDQYTVSAFDAATDPTTASGATDTTTVPTNGTWIERSDSNTATGADTGLGIADAVRASAGATGTIQATVSSASGRNVMMAAAFKLNHSYAQSAAGFYEDGAETSSTLIDDASSGLTATYYFDANDGTNDSGGVWTNDANAFDGNTATFATTSTTGTSSSNFLQGDGTTASAASTGSVTSVRARIFSYGNVSLAQRIDAEIFTDGLGESLGTIFGTNSGGNAWSEYTTLSTPAGGWTWTKVNLLEIKLSKKNGSDVIGFARAEIEVTYAEALDITRDVSGGDSNVQLRMRLQETAGSIGSATDDYQLQVSKNGGAYASVDTAEVLGFNSASLTDGNATTNRLGSGSGSFVAGKISEDGLVDNLQITASNYTELLYSLTIESTAVADNDTLDFRVLRNGTTTGLTYTLTPRITIEESTTSAVITGTITPSATEADIVAGGKTLIITLTGDTWIAAGALSFDLQRDEIIAGIDSAQSEATGWDLVPKATQSLGGVVRTSNTVVTITWDAFPTYNITSTETITVTIPGSALTGGLPIVATPTFTVTPIQGQVNFFRMF